MVEAGGMGPVGVEARGLGDLETERDGLRSSEARELGLGVVDLVLDGVAVARGDLVGGGGWSWSWFCSCAADGFGTALVGCGVSSGEVGLLCARPEEALGMAVVVEGVVVGATVWSFSFSCAASNFSAFLVGAGVDSGDVLVL